MSDDLTDKRIARLKAIKAELASTAGLDVHKLDAASKIRLENAVWLTLSMENLRLKILEGEVVEVTAMEKYTIALNSLLPQAQTLNVHLIDGSDECIHCHRPFSDDLPRAMTRAEARKRRDERAGRPEKAARSSKDENASAVSPVPPKTFTNEKLNEPQNVHGLIGRLNGGASRSPFDPPPRSSRFDNKS